MAVIHRCRQCRRRATISIVTWKKLGVSGLESVEAQAYACEEHSLDISRDIEPLGHRTVWHEA
jgi:hypothetical protein